mgnify:FL=1|jgi:hypothetical protein
MEKLKQGEIPFAVVNTKNYRLGNRILDYEIFKMKYPTTEYAEDYDNDMDEVCRHK